MDEIERLKEEIAAKKAAIKALEDGRRHSNFVTALKARNEDYELTIEEAAGVFDVTPGRVRNMISQGDVVAIGERGHKRIRLGDALKVLIGSNPAHPRALFVRTLWEN